jgi:type II secretory pathway predicted ATPase ExeA
MKSRDKQTTTTASQFFDYRYPPFADTFEVHEPFRSDADAIASQRAVAMLRQGRSLAIHGESGSGKSMLTKTIINLLEAKSYRVVILPYGGIKPSAILRELCEKFDLDTSGRKNLLSRLADDFTRDKQKPFPVILVDDAHEMQNQSFLDLCSLLHDAQSRTAAASMLLVGQPQLKRKLELDIFAPVRTRLACLLHLPPLTIEEARAFILFRLEIAQAHSELFDEQALECLAVDSKGNRRMLMNLGALCLEEAARRKEKVITAEIVTAVSTEMLN